MAPNNGQLDPNGVAAVLRRQHGDIEQLKDALNQVMAYMKGMANVPKYIDDIPGMRSPWFEPIEITIAANSTAKREGTATVSTDGPFVVTGVMLFHKKTSGAYANIWGPATAFDARIPPVGQQHGFAYLFDQPHCASYTVEITVHGADRLWQGLPLASAVFSPQAGGAYILPAAHLVGRNSTIRLAVTPDVSMPYTATVQGIFLGFKIIQGAQFQP